MPPIDAIAPHWWWLSLAFALALTEMVVPGVFLIWLGGAALATGLATLAFDLPNTAQIAVMTVAAIGSVYAGRRFISQHPTVSEDPKLNDRVGRLIGHVVTVTQAFENGEGRVRVGDSDWLATGPDLPLGAKARVTGGHGAALEVEAA
jgi:membrane protein implicated in regulation of membrane protease activity